MIQIAIMGHGVVGCGVAQVLQKNAAAIAKKAGAPLQVTRILDLRSFPDLPYSDAFTTRFEDILEDAAISIVVETMGGLHPAYDYVKACLLAGKSVVTSNKELVAQKGDELLAIAAEKNVNFLFEASVGGGIPILRPLSQCLAANEITEILGILNGTTNFMLTKMIDEAMSFEDALALAQQLGYAERDPSADIDGLDACRKICILASLAFGEHIYPDAVTTEGIRRITLTDVQYAAALGCVIKLIGSAVKTDEGLYCTVAPMLLPQSNILAGVGDVFNAILVRGDAVGDVAFYGRGAGMLPTASAVVADVIDAAKHRERRRDCGWVPAGEGGVADPRTATAQYLLRFVGMDVVPSSFGAVRPVTIDDAPAGELAFVTPPMTGAALEAAITASGATLVSRIRLADI